MDTTANFGMKTIAVQGQSGLGCKLQRTMNTQVYSHETEQYALGLIAESKNYARYTRSNTGIDTFIHIVADSISSSDFCLEQLTTNDALLNKWVENLQHCWFYRIGAHYDHHPLNPMEKTMFNDAECEYIYHHPEYIYRFMTTIVIADNKGAALVHTGDAHPLFIAQTGSIPMIPSSLATSWFGNPENDGFAVFSQVIPLAEPRTIAILNDSLYRAITPDYLTNIYHLLGYYPDLADNFIHAQMPLLSTKVHDEDLGIVVLFEQYPSNTQK